MKRALFHVVNPPTVLRVSERVCPVEKYRAYSNASIWNGLFGNAFISLMPTFFETISFSVTYASLLPIFLSETVSFSNPFTNVNDAVG